MKKTKSQWRIRKLDLTLGLIIGLALGYAIALTTDLHPQLLADLNSQIPFHSGSFLSNSQKPQAHFHLDRTQYCLDYDGRLKQASWVCEELTKESLNGKADRNHHAFQEDPDLPLCVRSTLVDYKGSGFDRGHMAPAANHKTSDEALADTFYLSNMSPQHPKLNRGYWSKLEKYVRELTYNNDRVHVITGPLFLPREGNDGKKFVTYQVIGPNNVAVPTHYFKLISVVAANGYKETYAYILPNEEIPSKTPLDNFRTSVQKVEKAAGILFAASER